MMEKELLWVIDKLDVKNEEEGYTWYQKCFKKEPLSPETNTEIFMDEMI